MARKRKKRYNIFKFPIIGKYIDTPTKSTMKVVYFTDGIGEYKFKLGNLPEVVLKGCRFQLKVSEVKRKKKFFKKLKVFLDFSNGWRELERPTLTQWEVPLLFGLLKLRKGKQRNFVLIQAADQYYKGRTINISAVIIDNLLYLDLVNKLKNDA